MLANLENSAVATGLEKVSFHSSSKKVNAKECLNYCTIALTSHASNVMLKILQARLQQYMNHELPDVQAVFIIIYLYFFILLYNTVLVLPYTDMNQPRVYNEFPILNPPPTSHSISSLWIIPVHQPQASCILY